MLQRPLLSASRLTIKRPAIASKCAEAAAEVAAAAAAAEAACTLAEVEAACTPAAVVVCTLVAEAVSTLAAAAAFTPVAQAVSTLVAWGAVAEWLPEEAAGRVQATTAGREAARLQRALRSAS